MDKTGKKVDILTAAGKVFSEKGYAAATVEEIAESAGVAKGSVYNYFSSKQELFTALFIGMIRQDEDAEEELFSRDLSAKEKLDLHMDHWGQRFGEYQKIGRLVLEFWTTAAAEEDGPFGAELGRVYEEWH